MAANWILGPVLSFRGIKGEHWCVTALIGIKDKHEKPVVLVEGQECDEPLVLLQHKDQTFFRYDLSCKMRDDERRVEYSVNGVAFHFTVPAKRQSPRMAYVSCNGYSDSQVMSQCQQKKNDVWVDLVSNHDRQLRDEAYKLDREQLWHEANVHDNNMQRFHILLMGGDQIYFDSIWSDCHIKELEEWVGLSSEEQIKYKVKSSLRKKLEDYYFWLYTERWVDQNQGECGRTSADAMATIPTVMMWDDHDIFDGWGSFRPERQKCDLYQTMFYCARRAFWVFQMQHAIDHLPELENDAVFKWYTGDDPTYKAIQWHEHQREDPVALPLLNNQPGFSYAFNLGEVALLVADLRTERSRTQILGNKSWVSIELYLEQINSTNETKHSYRHFLLLSSVPVIHPKLTAAELLLDLLDETDYSDDLKDHWSHRDHAGERVRLLKKLTDFAISASLRVSILSGDVHVAALGVAYRKDIQPVTDCSKVMQLTSSAVVHPSLQSRSERFYLYFLSKGAKDEEEINDAINVKMLTFPASERCLIPARNWLALETDKEHKLWATWRCETGKSSRFTNHLQTVDAFQCKT